MNSESPQPHKRRPRYSGKNPRHFSEKYKERNPSLDPATLAKVIASGKTPAGMHIPIMVDECMEALQLRPGMTGVDCTLGFGGHAENILLRINPDGFLLGLDSDPIEIEKTTARIRATNYSASFGSMHINYAGITKAISSQNIIAADFIFADLGCSSMQLDDPSRGFTYKHEGPLDMRMNPSRGNSAQHLLENITAEKLATILDENADEPLAEKIAHALAGKTLSTTSELVLAIRNVVGGDSTDHIKRTFQAIRIAVNDEFGALDSFLQQIPYCLSAGARVAILTFHSGEDRRVKKSFQHFLRQGIYSLTNSEVILASLAERRANPRSIPAKLRFAQRA